MQLESICKEVCNRISTIDITSLVISIIALLVSIVATVVAYQQFKHSQRLTLESQYFGELFKSYLVKKFPKAEAKIYFDGEKISGIDALINVASDLRKRTRYFAYADEEFYIKLKTLLHELEDLLVDAMNHQYDCEEQTDFRNDTKKLLKEIYSHISKRYSVR